MTKEMGLDRAHIEFQTSYFSNIWVNPLMGGFPKKRNFGLPKVKTGLFGSVREAVKTRIVYICHLQGEGLAPGTSAPHNFNINGPFFWQMLVKVLDLIRI